MSFRSLVRSTVLVSSSSAATTIIAILRVKVVALLVGPAGVGLLGSLAAIAGVGTTLAACGSDTSGMRRLALDRHDPAAVAGLRQILFLIAALHGALSLGFVYLFRAEISQLVLGSEANAFEVGLLGVAIALSLMAGLQIAQLQGLGRVGDMVRVNILSSIAGTAVGVAAVWHWGVGGLIVLVLAQPAVAALLATIAAGGIATGATAGSPNALRARQWWAIVSQGAPYMASFLMAALVPLAIRAIVIRELGMEAAGHFHAAWTMSVIYIGFLLSAMAADFFPRLTALCHDRPQAIRLINDQAQLALAIGGMALLVMLAGAPLLIPLLYSAAFGPAVELVEWQAFGNLMKLAVWPIGFLAMARGRSRQFFLIELAWNSLMLALVWLLLPHLGLAATGLAFALACLVSLGLQTVVGYVSYGFTWARETLAMLAAFAAAGAVILIAARHSIAMQVLAGAMLALPLGIASLRLVCARLGDEGRFAGAAHRGFRRVGWPLPV